jgi:hypothetical protein
MGDIAATQVPERAVPPSLRRLPEARVSDRCGMMTAIRAGRVATPGVAMSEQEPR